MKPSECRFFKDNKCPIGVWTIEYGRSNKCPDNCPIVMLTNRMEILKETVKYNADEQEEEIDTLRKEVEQNYNQRVALEKFYNELKGEVVAHFKQEEEK